MSEITALLKSLGWSGAVRLVSAASGLLLVVLMAHQWSPALYGEYAIVYGYYALLQQAPLLGLNLAVSRNVAAAPEDGPRETRAVVAIALLAGLIFALLMGATGELLYPPALHPAFWLGGLALVPTGATVALESALIGYARLPTIALVNTGENVARIAVFALIIERGGGLTPVMAAFLFLRVAAALCYVADRRLGVTAAIWRVDRTVMRAYLMGAPVFFAILVLAAAMARLDIIIYSALGTTTAEVGVYAVAAKLYEMTLLAPIIVTVATFPILSRLSERDETQFRRLVSLISRYSIVLALPCALAVSASAHAIVTAIFPAQFSHAALPLAILVFATVAVAGAQPLSSMLIIRRLQRYDLRALSFSAPILAALVASLALAAGSVGVAAGVLAGNAVQLAFKYRYCRRHAGLPAMTQDLGVAMIAFVAAALVVVLLPVPLVPRLSLALAVYLGLLLLMRSVSLGDLEAVRAAFAANSG
jgi:O-antigen/teichoic acid export membrane protein